MAMSATLPGSGADPAGESQPKPLVMLHHGYMRIDGGDTPGRTGNFGPADIGSAMNHLTLQVVERNSIIINDANSPNTRRPQV